MTEAGDRSIPALRLEDVGRILFGDTRHFAKERAGPVRALVLGDPDGARGIALARRLAATPAGPRHEVVRLADGASDGPPRPGIMVDGVPVATLARDGLDGARPFDFIDAVLGGAKPFSELPELMTRLAPDGGLRVSVAGGLGNLGLGCVRELLGLVAPPTLEIEERLEIVRRVLQRLPATNLLRRGPDPGLERAADETLRERLLEPAHPGFTVPELFRAASEAGLRLVAFEKPERYDPGRYLDDPALRESADRLPWPDRCAIAELMAGDMCLHVVFAVRGGKPRAGMRRRRGRAHRGSQTSDRVRAQYEAHPYPARRPEDESRRLIPGSPSGLAELIHYVFGGRRPRNGSFRALFAGGGTGDGAVMLAQQLEDAGVSGEIVHLDVSRASQAVARARAEVRGLENMRFVTGSLLDARALDLGLFDYVDCCGVLHHLEDPLAGLDALTQVLTADGGLGIMVYGELGRTGVYHAQEVLRRLAPGGPEGFPDDERVRRARALLEGLPPKSWFARNPFVRDHLEGGDAGLYDLLLHARDRAFRVDELLRLVARTGLRVATFIEPLRYDALALVDDPVLRDRLVVLAPAGRMAFAELFACNLKAHVFYAVREGNPVRPPDPSDRAVVPVLREMTPNAAAAAIPAGGAIAVRQQGVALTLSVPPLATAIVARCDGHRTVEEIYRDLCRRHGALDWPAFQSQFAQLYATLNGINRMLLAYPR